MSKYLLSHGHLCIDGEREYLDGAILFEDNKLIQIYPHSNKLKVEDADEINLRGQLVFPLYTKRIDAKKMMIYSPKAESTIEELMKIKEADEYVLIKDSNTDITAFILKNLSRHRVILASDRPQQTLKKLHEKGVAYSDLSLMTYANIEKAHGRDFTSVKGSEVNFVVLDRDFKEIFRIENGEFIYD